MLVLLPPSETKRPGGEGAPLDFDGLALPSLRSARESVVDALVALSSDEEEAARVLKISAKRRHEVADNAALRTSPTLPAIDRYTGVLFDALDAGSLEAPARSWLSDHVMIHSAPLGPVAALDGIPAYRLAAGTSVPGIPSLRRIWAGAVSEAWEELRPDFVVDLRSEAYAALGPLPAGVPSAYVRVMSEDSGGEARALNHFNKHAKGALVRALASQAARIGSLEDLHAWAQGAGWTLRAGGPGEVALIV
ncbi:peroxide stress protein YaaA [Microbacterium testaceum]|uniref:YaaA family protein n=1 Tax=Microbacterium testaceum TaxID=2033 RepID=UPI000CCEBAAE|nr:peroxide stress protein YaaA [Microbacterium testaceum]PNW07955.1 peroxide stress protein YaaA [Microbacterium testaceum]